MSILSLDIGGSNFHAIVWRTGMSSEGDAGQDRLLNGGTTGQNGEKCGRRVNPNGRLIGSDRFDSTSMSKDLPRLREFQLLRKNDVPYSQVNLLDKSPRIRGATRATGRCYAEIAYLPVEPRFLRPFQLARVV